MSIVNDKMSDTPETDDQPVINAINENGYQVPCVDIEYARKLERERNKAQESLREAWLAMDEIDGTDRMNDWQNKYAYILEDAK